MCFQFNNQPMPPGLYLNDIQCQNLFNEFDRLKNLAYKEKEARKTAEKKLKFYESGNVDSSESIREISDKCKLTILYRGNETEIAYWYIEKCHTVLFSNSENTVIIYLYLEIKAKSVERQIIIKESDLKGTKIIDIFENNGCPIMQIGSRQRRALQFIRYIRSKAQSGNVLNFPFINGWGNGKYIYSNTNNAMFKEVLEIENPYTMKYFPNTANGIYKNKEILKKLVETFGKEDVTLAFSIGIWGMLYSIFAKYGYQEEKMLSIESKKNSVLYERLMTQWEERRVFDVSQKKKYAEIVSQSKDEVSFFRMDVCSNYEISNVSGTLLPMIQRHEIADSKTGEIKKIKSLFIIETYDYRILDKVLKLPFNMEKDIKVNISQKDISAFYLDICKFIESNYKWAENIIKNINLKNDVIGYKQIYFCLKISNLFLNYYFYKVNNVLMDENSFDSYIIEWLNGNIKSYDKDNGEKIIQKIIEMKNEEKIRFLCREKYDYLGKEGIIFLVDEKWIYIPKESIINIANDTLGNISKNSIKKILVESNISEMENGHLGVEVIVGKEKRRARMVRIKRNSILSDSELMFYMEV